MSPSPPSHACWTCHLRKKKCSGGVPACVTCTQLSIPCYGYDDRPAWMDGGEAEKKKIAEIRRGVKTTTDKLRRARALGSLNKKAKAVEYDSSTPILNQTNDLVKSPIKGYRIRAANGHSLDSPWDLDDDVEALLLMHYLDHVFPLMFSFYNPSIAEGGRGWLLGLLKQTKSVHDAALTLATYHRQMVLRETTTLINEPKVQEQIYTLALQGLREHIEVIRSKTPGVNGLKDSIDIFACIIHLILLEVVQGGTEGWLDHLRIAPNLIEFLQIYCHEDDNRKYLSSSESWIPPSSREMPTPLVGPPMSHSELSAVDHSSVHFFSAVLVWFNILAATTTQQLPQYASICSAALGDFNSAIQLQNIMGCENWAMVIIRDISILNVWKLEMRSKGILSMRELASRAGVLEEALKSGINQLHSRISQGGSRLHVETYSNPETLTLTLAFASAAAVYLNVTISGANPAIPEIASAVQQTLEALKSLPSYLLRSAVWPLCIAGCMTAPTEEASWRDFVKGAENTSRTLNFGNVPHAWEVVETCWRLRKEETVKTEKRLDIDWATAMHTMGFQVLLV